MAKNGNTKLCVDLLKNGAVVDAVNEVHTWPVFIHMYVFVFLSSKDLYCK